MKPIKVCSSLLLFLSLIGSTVKADDNQATLYYNADSYEIGKNLLLKNISNGAFVEESCYQLGKIYFSEQKSDSASFFFKKGLSVNPESALNKIGTTMLLIKGDAVGSKKLFGEVLSKKNKKNVDLILEVARAYISVKQPEEAEIYILRAQEVKKNYPKTFVAEGDLARLKENYGEASSKFEQAIYFDKNTEEAYVKYAKIYARIKPSLAIEKLQALKEVNPNNKLADKELAKVYYNQNQLKKAIEMYDVFISGGVYSISDLSDYATSLFLDGQFAKSLEVAQKSLEFDASGIVMKRLSMYNSFELKEYDKGLEAAKELFIPKNAPYIVSYDYLYYSYILGATNHYAEAVPQLKKAYELDTVRFDLLKELSETYTKLNDYSHAAEYYKLYMKANPDVSMSDYLALGRIYYQQGGAEMKEVNGGDKSKAIETLKLADAAFTKITEEAPEIYLGHLNRARVNSQIDPTAEQGLAKPHYEAALAILEANEETKATAPVLECCRYLGYYYYIKNDFAQSKPYWNKIQELNPADEQAKQALAGMK